MILVMKQLETFRHPGEHSWTYGALSEPAGAGEFVGASSKMRRSTDRNVTCFSTNIIVPFFSIS